MVELTTEINPYPGADDAAWTHRLALALQEYSGWPLEVAEDIAAYVVRPKAYLVRSGGHYRLDPAALTRRSFGSDVQHHIFTTRVHGFMGSLTEYNERVRSAFPAPAAPGAQGQTLPQLTTKRGDSGEPLALLETAKVIDEDSARALIKQTDKAMQTANGRRPWDLRGELLLQGQEEPSMHAVIQRRFRGDDGAEYIVTDPMAIIGNNRSQARQECLGIDEGTQFGFAPRLAGWAPATVEAGAEYVRSADWAPIMAKLLKQAWEDVPADIPRDHPRRKAHERAREAGRLAQVPAQFILKVTDAEGSAVEQFERVVWEPNRTSHRRQPLAYDPHERATAEVRAVLAAYVNDGCLSAAEAEWLAGDAPAPQDLTAAPGMTTADLRDLRDLRLWKVIFPGREDQRADLVRRTLGEPRLRDSRYEHVQQRLRLVTAAISVGYGQEPWSERVNDGQLKARAIRDGWSPGERSAAQLLRAASKAGAEGLEALEEFIITRGVNWLAFHELHFADRGSIGMGQKTQGLVRRSAVNVRTALLRNPAQAVGLFREIQRASGKPGQAPRPIRQVDEAGEPIAGTTADPGWFLVTFPKSARDAVAPDPGQTRHRKPTKSELLYAARVQFVDHTFEQLLPAVADTFVAAQKLGQAAVEAGERGLHDDTTGTAERLREAFAAVRKDAAVLLVLLSDLNDEEPKVTETSVCAQLVAQDDDEDDEPDDQEWDEFDPEQESAAS
jgi:hypothetical protein